MNVWAQEAWNSFFFYIKPPQVLAQAKIPLDVISSLSPLKMKHTEE